jgi:hypothetical protein
MLLRFKIKRNIDELYSLIREKARLKNREFCKISGFLEKEHWEMKKLKLKIIVYYNLDVGESPSVIFIKTTKNSIYRFQDSSLMFIGECSNFVKENLITFNVELK